MLQFTNLNLTALLCKKVLLLKTGNCLSPTLLIWLLYLNLVLSLMLPLPLMLKLVRSLYLAFYLPHLMLDQPLKSLLDLMLLLDLVLLVPILSA